MTQTHKSSLESNLSNTMAIRLFKQSKRVDAVRNHIQARCSQNTPFEEALQHYKNIYEKRLPDVDEDPLPPHLTVNDMIPALFTSTDLLDVVTHYPTHKSGGPDGFDARLFQVLVKSRTFCFTLYQLFKLFYESATSPAVWNHSIIFLLLKDEQEPFADKTRPVSLTNMLRRFYEKLLLKSWADAPWASLHPSQAGFRRGFNTMTQIIVSDELSKDNSISAFLDLSAAFDRVPHTRLLEILQQRGCPKHILKVIFQLMMSECWSTLVVNNKRLPDRIERKHGVFQGSVLSPFLFNVFIDPLAKLLNDDTDLVPIALFYADDITIKARTDDRMKQSIQLCEIWALENGMRWGIQKCGVIGSKSVFFLNGERIPSVSRYKYLGSPHGRHGILWGDFLAQKEESFERLVKGLLSRRRTWLFKTRLIIFKTFIRSTIDYCLPLITLWIDSLPKKDQTPHLSRLENIQRRTLEFIFDTDKPRALLEGISGLGDYRTRSNLLQASFSLQLRNLSTTNPLQHFLTLAPLLSHRGSILQQALSNKLAREFQEYCRLNPLVRRRWATFAQHKILENNINSKGCLQNYIRRRARFKLRADTCLYLPLEDATRAVKWRSNKMFLNKVCPQCHSLFSRSHIATCLTLPEKYTNLYKEENYRHDLDDIFRELADKGNGEIPDFIYTPLDYLLNEKRYEDFKELNEYIDALLQRP
jgi:hypothetical protein